VQFRNRQGTPVDPVPFFVVTSMAFLLIFSFGPGYLLAVGFDLAVAILVSAGVFAAVTAGAYHQLVWTSRPDLRAEIPGTVRLQRLIYVALILGLLMVGLLIPLL
jgi:hypothetical protein